MKCAIHAGFVVMLYLENQMDKYRGHFSQCIQLCRGPMPLKTQLTSHPHGSESSFSWIAQVGMFPSTARWIPIFRCLLGQEIRDLFCGGFLDAALGLSNQ